MAIQQSDDWRGRMLGRYRLTQLLGRGGMGEVWLATDEQLGRQVAVKLLPAAHMNNRNYLQDFAYEARAAAALEHPHILPIHDYGEQSTSGEEVVTYLVMPYISGGSLRDRLYDKQQLLEVEEGLRYLRQAASRY